jgi:putative solute:sodium symporter small subunit
MKDSPLTRDQAQAYWAKTSKLMWTLMIVWAVFGYGVHFFAPQLNNIVILGFPMGFYMGAQGALIVFVWICFWNAKKQDEIDAEFGVSDE